MATRRPKCNQSLLCILIYLFTFTFDVQTVSENVKWLKNISSGRLQLRNLGEKEDKVYTGLNDDGYFPDTRQETPDPSVLGGIKIKHEAQKLSARLRWLSNEEIGITKMQAIYDSLPYEKKEQDPKSTLHKIARRLKKRFKNYIQVLHTNKITVQNMYKFHVRNPMTSNISCCMIPSTEFVEDNQYGCRISKRTSCDLYPDNVRENAFNPGRMLTEVWKDNKKLFPGLKWQYFISVDGLHTEYPANAFSWFNNCPKAHDIRHSDVYLSTVQPQPQHVVIVMDHGNSLSSNQLKTAKGIAKQFLNSLSERDRVAVFGLASRPSFPRDPRDDSCLPNSLVPATFEASLFFSSFVDNLRQEDASTNHSLGFQTAFEMIENMVRRSKGVNIENAMILYISRGLLSSLTEGRDIMETISIHNGRLDHRVIINTYAVIDDGKHIMFEKSILQDIAEQNFHKYEVQYKSPKPVIAGMMVTINSTKDLSVSVGKFYLPLNKTAPEASVFSLPYMDMADQTLTMSISQPCFHGKELIGIMGIDLHMEDVVQDVTYYNQDINSYVFLINTDGYTIMHPSFNRPMKTRIQPMHTDIWHFENKDGFARIRSDMLNLPEGERVMQTKRVNTNSTDDNSSKSDFTAKYIWKRIENTTFIVVLKVLTETGVTQTLEQLHVSNDPHLVYHRLDLVQPIDMCLHRHLPATTDTSTVFLSAKSFLDPFEHLSNLETKRMVQNYVAYLKDDTRLITNPGLKMEVKNDVAATGRINTEWLRRYHHRLTHQEDSIVRRYVATPSGVFRTFPGAVIDKTSDPTKTDWYQRAEEFPGHVTLTPPYLDTLGAGYITTISHTIFEGKPASLHSPKDRVVAAMGMDLTLGFLHKLLSEVIPTCTHKNIRCFIMDDKGYLVAHPKLIEPNSKVVQHITHKEQLVANDILNHKHFVKKTLCNSYNDRTIQRFYKFNTSLEGVLTNLVHGEHCARYQITHIPGTNAFLGIVNHTCNTDTAFCPCSTVDRLCLNCNQMEQIVCECPCECPLDMNFCTGELLQEDDRNPSCAHQVEKESQIHLNFPPFKDVHQCHEPKCNLLTTKLDCISAIGCAWCERQKHGLATVKWPYCADQRHCFGGVEEAVSPYGDEIRAMANQDKPIPMKSTPVGPVAGGIMGCFLVLALGVYCYRHHIHRNSHQYISNLPENQNRMSHFYEEEPHEPADDIATGHTNFVLATFDNPASISPYRVNTSYRRPAGGDSDHGYSTMTPHEDSEHASLPCLEPLIKERYKPGSLSVVKNTPGKIPPPPSHYRRSRSPTPPKYYQPIPEQTVIPPQTTIIEHPHNVITNVQVHMVDTH
ncbi:VWFA and cache domain-containing protein 1-like [Saccostrea echinata]|uniref:VWFA and cache domain-containing protein 1-like n=1 Tax=Saccostrea echinata TaxID=191078 RepID=UPI002A7ED1AD|nr:VWFA and cache domain-containing protein 1-like [Saccostrea echinata]